jgi:hypothetical protein
MSRKQKTLKSSLKTLRNMAKETKASEPIYRVPGALRPAPTSRSSFDPSSALPLQECIDCGECFVITADEQRLVAAKGWTLPKRCHHCRRARRQGDTLAALLAPGVRR